MTVESGEAFDTVGLESTPVATIGGDDHGGLKVSERLDLLQRCTVLTHVDNGVLRSLGVETAVSCVALDAPGLRVDSDH